MPGIPVALLLAGFVTCSLACNAKVEVSAGGGGKPIKLGTFTCAEVKDDTCVDATDKFTASVPVVHMIHQTKDIPTKGDVYSIQWIAEDVGDAAAPDTVISTLNKDVGVVESATTSYFVGSELSRPTAGWPVGKYRVDVKMGQRLVTSASFSIE